MSIELLFRLFGGSPEAIKLVRKIRTLTSENQFLILKEWANKIKAGLGPSFVVGQQDLHQWMPVTTPEQGSETLNDRSREKED
jgi:hypothetical protein